MTNPSPLEKQLLHMELSKGVNERDRPETAASATTLTRVENLVQDQTGSFVKRTGLTPLASPVTPAERLLPLKGGLAAVCDGGEFYALQEGGVGFAFKRRGSLSRFSVTAAMVGNAGQTSGANITAAASCTAFHAAIVAGVGWLELYDRASEAVVARYNILQVCGLVQGTLSYEMAVAAFVDDRYLHVHLCGDSMVRSFIIDTGVALPDPDTYVATTVTSAIAGAGGELVMLDLDVGPGASYLLVGDENIPFLTSVVKLEADLTATVGPMPDESRALSYSPHGTGELWVVSAVGIGHYDPATLGSVAYSPLAFVGAEAMAAITNGHRFTMLADSGGTAWVAYEYTYTLDTGKTCTSVKLWRSPSSMSLALTHYATIDGWRIGSHPIEFTAGRNYSGRAIHLVKESSTMTYSFSRPQGTVPHVLVSIIPAEQSLVENYSSGAAPSNSFPILASMETELGLFNSMVSNYGGVLKMPRADGATELREVYTAVVPLAVTARGVGYSFLELRTNRQQDRSSVVFGGSNYISGGTHMSYAGGRVPSEVGFPDIPIVTVRAYAGAGGIGTGSYRYLAVYRHNDDLGNVTWSRCSEIMSVTTTGVLNSVSVMVVPPNVTNKDDGVPVAPTTKNRAGVVVELYRTANGGTQFYLVASSAYDPPTATFDMAGASRIYRLTNDAIADGTLTTMSALFRQPGTPNSAVDRYPPPAGNIIIQHKDRMFTVDSLGSKVRYTSFHVDGETAWYNPAFGFYVHGGTGPITALASMDGRLVVFKRDAVFVVDGDGPGEGGVTGNEYSPPMRLATEHGCISHRSVVVTTEGVVYRSTRGIELLTRAMKVTDLGSPVQGTVAANPETLGASLDERGRLSFLVGDGTYTYTSTELVYDFTASCWTINTLGTYGASDVAVADVSGFTGAVCYASPAGPVLRKTEASEGTYIDQYATYVPFTVETAWLKAGQQTRARFTKLLALLKRNTGCNHKLTISAAFNYVNTYTQVATWEPGQLNQLEIEELEMQLARQEVMAVRLKIQDGLPTARSVVSSTDATPIVVTHATAHGFVNGDTITISGHLTNVAANGTFVVASATALAYALTASVGSGAGDGTGGTAVYPVGTGRGPDVLGISVEMAVKTGSPKGPAGQKA